MIIIVIANLFSLEFLPILSRRKKKYTKKFFYRRHGSTSFSLPMVYLILTAYPIGTAKAGQAHIFIPQPCIWRNERSFRPFFVRIRQTMKIMTTG